MVGAVVGATVGAIVGAMVGALVGAVVGAVVGIIVGVGAVVGDAAAEASSRFTESDQPLSSDAAHRKAPPYSGKARATLCSTEAAWAPSTLLPVAEQSAMQNPNTTLLASPPKMPFTKLPMCVTAPARSRVGLVGPL
mmetsp:Transcript_44395/g.123461  ORF Transcript_44395/g.123461 Transcript_44395/m.123461 type:complete len:137 (-) Transcript_44395:698-1108(-)